MPILSSIVMSKLGVPYSGVGALVGLIAGYYLVNRNQSGPPTYSVKMALGTVGGGILFGLLEPLP